MLYYLILYYILYYIKRKRGVVYGGDKRTVKGEKEGINKSIKKRQEMIYIYTILCMP